MSGLLSRDGLGHDTGGYPRLGVPNEIRIRDHLDQTRCLYCGGSTSEPFRITRRFEWRSDVYLVPLVFCSRACARSYERMRESEGTAATAV